MADNVQLNIPTTSGATIATDDVAGIQHQLIKVEFGADGVATPVTAAAPLPVTDAAAEASLSSIDAKLTNPLPISGTVTTGGLTDTQLRATPVPVSGTVTANTGLTQYTEDAAAAANPVGTAVNLIRQDTPATLTTTDGDNVSQRGTNYGAAYTQVVTSAGAFVDTFGGGTQYADGAVRGTATGTLSMGDDGTNIQSVHVDTSGDLQVDVLSSALPADAATQTTLALIKAKTDNIPAQGQALAAASTPVVLTAAQVTTLTPPAAITGFNLEATQLLVKAKTDNLDVALSTRLKPADTLTAVALNSDVRQATAANLNMTEASAASILTKVTAGAASMVKLEDVASADGDAGTPAMAVRKASPANTSGTDGDYEMLQMSAGRLWTSTTVDAALPAGSNVIGHVIADTGSTTAVTGNVTVVQPTGTNLHAVLDANSGVDIGKLTANQSINTAQVNAVTVLTGTGATGTGSQRVTVAVDSATVAGSASLPAGTNAIGKLSANSGVTIGAVEIAAAQTLATVTTVGTLTNITNNNPSGSVAHDGVGTGVNPLLVGGYASAAAPADVSLDGDAVREWKLRNGATATVLTAAGALIGGDAANGLDVDVTRLPALVAGSALVGKVSIDQITANANEVVTKTGSTTVVSAITSAAANAKVDVGLVNGEAVDVGAGTEAAAIRVTLPTDGTGKIATVTAVTAITNALPAGTNLLGKTGIDQTTPGTTNAVSLSQIGATTVVTGGVAGVLAVGGNVANAVAATANPVPVGGIFTTVPATLLTGQTGTMQFTAAQNIKNDITTIAGTAPTTVGKIDVKGADGDVFVRQATAANLKVEAAIAAAQTLATVTTVSTVTNLSQMGGVAISLNTGVRDTGTQRVTIATNDVVPVTDNSGSLTVDAPVATPVNVQIGNATLSAGVIDETGASAVDALAIGGGTAHDAVDSGNPLKMGAKAVSHGANPTAVAAGDRTNLFSNIAGIPFVIGGHPNIVSGEYYTTAAQTDDNILPAIAGGTIYVITGISVIASAANTVNVSVRIGFGTATVPAQGASGADAVSKVILSHPNIPAGSGITKGSGAGIVGIGGDGEELRITCSVPTTGSLIVQVDYYTITS